MGEPVKTSPPDSRHAEFMTFFGPVQLVEPVTCLISVVSEKRDEVITCTKYLTSCHV